MCQLLLETIRERFQAGSTRWIIRSTPAPGATLARAITGQHGLTPTGIFHITLLRLNRPQLVAHRLALRLQAVLREKISLLEQQNAELERTISAQEHYLAVLKAQSPAGGSSRVR
jgi:hypothetical protein